MDLPDLNVWLAMSVPDHPHHARAARYWQEEARDEVAFCRVTALGYLRLTTNPAVMGSNPLTTGEAWRAYAALTGLPEVVLAVEPEGCEAALEAWATADTFPPRMWTDAYLAAFAVAGGLRLVSFDNDFARFEGLYFLRLEP